MKKFRLVGVLAALLAVVSAFTLVQPPPPSCPTGYTFVYWTGGPLTNPSSFIVNPNGITCTGSAFVCGFCAPDSRIDFDEGVLLSFPVQGDNPTYYTDGNISTQLSDFNSNGAGSGNDEIVKRATSPI